MDIRPAVLQDAALLSRLCVSVQLLHADHHPQVFKAPQSDDFATAFFEQMLAIPGTVIYIAEEQGEALGYVFCKLVERPENPFTHAQRALWVDQISVRPGHQGRGIGTALMRQVLRYARQSGIGLVQLASWEFNTAAHAFFEGLGFHKFEHRFWWQPEK